MLKRIVLTGTYCSKNKGDAGMRIAAADSIRESIRDVRVTILTPFPEIDRYAYNGDPIIKCSRRDPIRAFELIAFSVWHRMAKRFGIRPEKLKCSTEMRSYLDADLIVDLSGDGLTEEYGLKCVISHLVPVIVGIMLGKPVFLCAQTIGPLGRSRFLAKWIFKRVDVITAREPVSMDYLRCLGLNGPRITQTADMAFSLKPCSARHAYSILEFEGIDVIRPLVGISVSRLHGHMLEVGHRCLKKGEFASVMASVADRIVENTGADVVLVSHTTGPGIDRDDREAAVEVKAACRNPRRVHVIKGDYSPSELKGIIGRMQLFVGLRMHSNIASLSMCVPTVAIAYGPKAHGIMALSGQSERTLDLRGLCEDRLYGMVEKAWNERQEIRRELETVMPRIKELSAGNIEIIADLLRDRVSERMIDAAAPVLQDGGSAVMGEEQAG
jgi:colanic acid/amylovoran biosynthesis protein